jgi:hypothetical protein
MTLPQRLKKVCWVIAVAARKGGVGKTTWCAYHDAQGALSYARQRLHRHLQIPRIASGGPIIRGPWFVGDPWRNQR